MAAEVILKVTSGPNAGKVFDLNGHDTFLIGRIDDCHLQFAGDDQEPHHYQRKE